MTNYSAAITGGTISGAMNWNPNGSLQSLTVADPFNAADNPTCTYAADDLGRLAGVNCGSTWAQTFTYDAFGNLTKDGSISWMPGYDPSTNHYTLGGTSYDADGNVLNDTFNTYTWDADGKNLSTYYQNGYNPQTWSFINDALGHHVEMSINGTYSTSYLALGKFKLSANGQSPNYSEYPLPGGSVLSQGGGATGVQLADWLGTIRAEYSYTGGGYQFSSAHAPFGETYASTASYPEGFAGNGGIGWGQSGDGVTGNTTYWFPERFLRSSQGRWLTPDPAGMDAADPSNPQSWNLYTYVLNNPLALVDPFGEFEESGGCKDSDTVSCVTAPPPDDVDYSMIGDNARTPGFQHFFRRGLSLFGIRATRQTFNQCLIQNAANYSAGGVFDLAAGTTMGNSTVGQVFAGNTFTGLYSALAGSGADAATAAGAQAPDLVNSAIGSTLTFGRRASNIMSLNLAGKGGLPQALGSSSGGLKSLLGSASKALNLGLDASVKAAGDLGLFGAEIIGCSIYK